MNEIVERARPTIISRTGKIVSILRVFLSRTCIKIFFLRRAHIWFLKRTNPPLSESVTIE